MRIPQSFLCGIRIFLLYMEDFRKYVLTFLSKGYIISMTDNVF